MKENLKETTKHAILWTAIEKVFTQIISVVIGIALARLLSSTDYGLVGMLAIFMAIATSLTDSGFSAALVRKVTITKEEYSTVFYFNIGISLLLYIGGYMSAPLIADFFRQPLLIPLSRVLFTVFIINALGMIQTVRLVKEIRLRRLAGINLSALVVSGVAALYAGLNGYGVWTLVVQQVVMSVAKTVLLILLGQWRPKLCFSFTSFREMYLFGGSIMLSGIINTLFTNCYSVVIGRLFNPSLLGYYSQASKWSDMGTLTLAGIIQNSTYTIFSAIQTEKERLIRAYRKVMRFTSFIAMPVLCGLALVAYPFVEALLGEKWITSVPYLQLLALGGIFTVFSAVNGNFIRIAGHSGVILRLEGIKVIVSSLVLALTWQAGMFAIVIGQVVTRGILWIYYSVVIGRRVNYSFIHQLYDILPYAAIAMGVSGILYILPWERYITSPLVLLMVQGGIFTVLYIGISYGLNSAIVRELLSSLNFGNRDKKEW